MDITVTGADALPTKAYLSIRAGDERKQVQFKPGVVFDLKATPKNFVVDVFEKVGSKQVRLSDLLPPAGTEGGGADGATLELPGRGGAPIKIDMKVQVRDPTGADADARAAKTMPRQQAATEAKGYLETCGAQEVMSRMVYELLAQRPDDAIGFMASFLRDISAKRLVAAETTPDLPIAPVGADCDTAGSPQDSPIAPARVDCEAVDSPQGFSRRPVCVEFQSDLCPDIMPDLAEKYSMAADVLRSDPSIYDRLKARKTPMGVSFATCVKTCFDNGGHPMIKTIGAVAGDETCYDIFRDLFEPLISRRHPTYSAGKAHPVDLDWTRVSTELLDPGAAGRVLSVRARFNRNLQGIRLMPACSLEERREVERATVGALLRHSSGEYFPAHGSNSYPPRPGGMSAEEESRLSADRLLFAEPDSQVLLSSGFAREWPDARGVFVGEDRGVLVWVNESDHLRMQTMQEGSDLRAVFKRLCEMAAEVEAALRAMGHSFARNRRLGFVGACPSNLGTCMTASAIIRIPLLSAQPRFRALCRQFKLQAHLGPGSSVGEGVWEVLNGERLGSSEIDQVNAVISGCRALLAAEARLERGEPLGPDAPVEGTPQSL